MREAGWFFKESAKPAKSYRVILAHLRFELADAGSGHWIVAIRFSAFSELIFLSAVALCCVLRWCLLLDSNSFLLAHPLCYWNLSLTSFYYRKLMKTCFLKANETNVIWALPYPLNCLFIHHQPRLHFLMLPKQVYQLGNKHSNIWVCFAFLIQTTMLFHTGVVWMYLTFISS